MSSQMNLFQLEFAAYTHTICRRSKLFGYHRAQASNRSQCPRIRPVLHFSRAASAQIKNFFRKILLLRENGFCPGSRMQGNVRRAPRRLIFVLGVQPRYGYGFVAQNALAPCKRRRVFICRYGSIVPKSQTGGLAFSAQRSARIMALQAFSEATSGHAYSESV
jgi:hypothetical protein